MVARHLQNKRSFQHVQRSSFICGPDDVFDFTGPLVRGIHRWPVESPNKWSVMRTFDVSFVISLNKLLNKHDHKQHTRNFLKIGLKFYNNWDAVDRSRDTTVMEYPSSSRYQSTDNKNALFMKTYITSLWRHWIFHYASPSHSIGLTLVIQVLLTERC